MDLQYMKQLETISSIHWTIAYSPTMQKNFETNM